MTNDKTIDVLNRLVEINNDRINGYETASNETEESELKSLFARFAGTSMKCRKELANEITRLGGVPTDGTKTTGKFFRAWMDVKAAITGKERKVILNSCEFGEDHALETYEDVIKNEGKNLSSEQQSFVSTQYALLKSDHNTVKTMRDSLVSA